MSEIRLSKLKIVNYRSFKTPQVFDFPTAEYLKPISIIGYNNSGKTTMMNAIIYGIGEKFLNVKTFEVQDLHNLDLENQIELKHELTELLIETILKLFAYVSIIGILILSIIVYINYFNSK